MTSHVHPKARTIYLRGKSNREFFLIHGYTGSPTDFNKLPRVLNKTFRAHVRVIRLIGHGTDPKELTKYEYEDYANYAEKELLKDLNKGRKIVIGGHSFGAQLALYLASKYNLRGTFAISAPYGMTYILSSKIGYFIAKTKEFWRKQLDKDEKKWRRISFYYKVVPNKILDVIRDANISLDKSLSNLKSPLLIINSKGDLFSNYKKIMDAARKIPYEDKEMIILEDKMHNPFFSPNADEVADRIVSFFKQRKVFQ